MYTPYAEDQKPSCPHGCYYPDITCRRDERRGEKIIRISYCIRHGYLEEELDLSKVLPAYMPILEASLSKSNPMPTEEWREKERQRIRGGQDRVYQVSLS